MYPVPSSGGARSWQESVTVWFLRAQGLLAQALISATASGRRGKTRYIRTVRVVEKAVLLTGAHEVLQCLV